ncbi:MAG: hypothetical protein KDC38_10030, partial [Planctomycetes bacterium]|nr:hypothetical protein [Planctomycetota bacterium]
GGHRFITGVPWILERVRSIVGDRLSLRTRKSFVFLDGTSIEYPLRFGDLMRKLGPIENARAVLSYVAATPRRWRRRSPSNLEEWLAPRFGRYLYRRVFEGYSEKLWGHHPTQMSPEWAPQRISIPSLGGYLRELFAPSRRPPRTYAREYLYPDLGIGEIPERFAATVVANGGEIRVGTEVTRLRRRAGEWIATLTSREDCEERAFDGIVGTITPTRLTGLLVGEATEGEPLPQRGLRFLNLGFDRPVPLDATWIYQPDPLCRFTRIQIPAARSRRMVPEGCGSIQLEEPWRTDDPSTFDDRVAQAGRTLDPLGLDLGTPTVAFETYAPDAYPIYRGGSRRRARDLIAQLEARAAVRVAGRQGRFDYIFFDRAIAQGVNAVRDLVGAARLPEVASASTPDAPLPLVEAQSMVGHSASGMGGDPL